MFKKLKSFIKENFPRVYLLLMNVRYYLPKKEIQNKMFVEFASAILDFKKENHINEAEIQNIFSDQLSKSYYLDFLSKMQYYITKNNFKFQELYSRRDYIAFGRDELALNKIIKNQRLDFEKYEYSVFVYKQGYVDLPDYVKKYIEKKDIIDAGAFIGDSAYVFQTFFNPRKVYSFEPEVSNFQKLQSNIQKYNLNKVIPICKGLGNSKGTYYIDAWGESSKIVDSSKSKVELTTVDDFVKENQIELGVIKLDVEGFGLELIEGALQSIQKFRPVLLISIYHNGKEYFEVPKLLHKYLKNYEYLLKKYHPLYLFTEITLIAYPNILIDQH